MDQGEKIKANAAWIAVCFFWGTTYLAIAICAKTLPVAMFAGSRFALAGIVLLGLCRWKGYDWPRGREWWHLGLVGVLLITCANSLLVWATKSIPTGMAALLVATAPFWMSGLEARTSGLRLDRNGIIGVLMGFIGMALLIGPNLSGAGLEAKFLLGVVALQVGCFCWCFGSLHSKRHPVQTHPLVGAAAQMLIGGLLLMLIGLCCGEFTRFKFNQESAVAFAYLVIFGSIVGYGAYIYALDKLPAAKVSMYAYINPIIAVLLGTFWLHERFDWQIALSMVIILSGVALVKTSEMKRTA